MIRIMRLADVLKLPSIDSDASTHPRGTYTDWSISSALKHLHFDHAEHSRIFYQMLKDGSNRVPIHVDYGYAIAEEYLTVIPTDMLDMLWMGNGHHRVAMMLDLGLTDVLVTDDAVESHGDD